MKYKVIKDFTDLKTDHVYRAGDTFPFKGKVAKARINELLTEKNKRSMPLIEEIEEVEADEE